MVAESPTLFGISVDMGCFHGHALASLPASNVAACLATWLPGRLATLPPRRLAASARRPDDLCRFRSPKARLARD